jgi:hypothetical protein
MTSRVNNAKSAQIPKKSAEPKTPIYGPQRQAVELTIGALDRAGLLNDDNAAIVEIARGLASMVDLEPDSGVLWREYRAAEKTLREEIKANGDPYEELIRSLSAPMGNEANEKPANSRA